MEHTENTFVVLKKHEEPIESSLHGKVMAVQQLCQNNNDKAHYFTYEVVDKEGSIVGGRLIYEFKNPNKALEQWNSYINDELILSSDFKVVKQELFQPRKPKI